MDFSAVINLYWTQPAAIRLEGDTCTVMSAGSVVLWPAGAQIGKSSVHTSFPATVGQVDQLWTKGKLLQPCAFENRCTPGAIEKIIKYYSFFSH